GRREGGRRRVSHRSRVYPRSASYDCPSRPRPTWRSSPTVIAGFDCLEPAIHPFGAFPSMTEGDGPAGHTRGGRTGGQRATAKLRPYTGAARGSRWRASAITRGIASSFAGAIT